MTETITLGEIAVEVTRKPVRHVHLSVHPPDGRVTLVAPRDTRIEVARAYAISKLEWIHDQQKTLRNQARETPRQYVDRETHYLWGRRYLLSVQERDERPEVRVDHKRIILTVRPGAGQVKRAQVLHAWHRKLLHEAIPPLVAKWERKLGVKVAGYFLQRMKTKWGSCNPSAGNIRLNTELVRKPKDLLEYIVVHEMLHLIEPTHSKRFIELLNQHFPTWREARNELNELPLSAEKW